MSQVEVEHRPVTQNAKLCWTALYECELQYVLSFCIQQQNARRSIGAGLLHIGMLAVATKCTGIASNEQDNSGFPSHTIRQALWEGLLLA